MDKLKNCSFANSDNRALIEKFKSIIYDTCKYYEEIIRKNGTNKEVRGS
ncbi:hypothetical protein [Hungatella hathewayi]